MGYSARSQNRYYKASNDLLLSADTERTLVGCPGTMCYELKKEFQLKERIVGSELRIKCDIKTSIGGIAANVRVYKNGIYTGDQFADDTGGYVTATFDIDGWGSEDRIQLYLGAIQPATSFIKNARIYGIYTIGVVNTD